MKKFFVLEVHRGRALNYFALKTLKGAEKRFNEVLSWDGERKATIVEAEKAVYVRWAVREKILGSPNHTYFQSQVQFIKGWGAD
jgi:hypothetical protein